MAVIQDLDSLPVGSFWGDVQAAVHQALGCIEVITNGGVRDIPAVQKAGFYMFSQEILISHAYVHMAEAGTAVQVCGMAVNPGDLLHADQHGAIVIPAGIAGRLAQACRQVTDAETLLENLLASDLRGIRSHGVTRLDGYMDRIERGVTSPTAQPSITTDHGPVFSVDGNSGMGSTIGMAVMAECIRRARQSGGQLPQSTTPPTTALAGFTQ